MKIETKVVFETVVALNALLRELYGNVRKDFSAMNLDSKITYSIGLDLADKIEKTYKSASRKDTLFDQSNRYKISFKVYEAWALYNILQTSTGLEALSDYQKGLLRQLSDRLHQKLS